MNHLSTCRRIVVGAARSGSPPIVTITSHRSGSSLRVRMNRTLLIEICGSCGDSGMIQPRLFSLPIWSAPATIEDPCRSVVGILALASTRIASSFNRNFSPKLAQRSISLSMIWFARKSRPGPSVLKCRRKRLTIAPSLSPFQPSLHTSWTSALMVLATLSSSSYDLPAWVEKEQPSKIFWSRRLEQFSKAMRARESFVGFVEVD